jgi:molybdopterin/thiamine biosynthesis adenylyltransferase
MRLPRIKRMQNPGRRADGLIQSGSGLYGIALELKDEPDGSIWRLMGLLDGTRDLETVVAQMCRDDPDLDGQSVRDSVRALTELGLVEDAGAPAPADLSTSEVERYGSNLRYFSWVDMTSRPSPYEQQRRLKQARVSLLGLGGTGSAVAMSLTAAGVGSLQCADFDVVEEGNLTRQLLYTEDDVGVAKVDAAVRRLRGINRHVEVTGRTVRAASVEDLLPLMDADIFMLCADIPLPDLQIWTNQAALSTGTPWMVSQYNGPQTLVGLFVPYRTPCFSCLTHQYPTMGPDPEQVWQPLYSQPAGHAVIAPVSIISGQLAALDAIYHLTGMPARTAGRIFRQSLVVFDHNFYLDLEFWPECPDCGGGRSHDANGTGRG